MAELSINARSRVYSIDTLRGLVMVIMALDHVRDFFFRAAVTAGGASVATNPTNMATTTPALFFTRWITHFCAPLFVFLAGTSVFLMTQKKSKNEISLFLIKRGFWLVIVELVIVSFSWSFNPLYNLFFLQVIWAIGISMILLGLLIRLPFWLILFLGIIIVFGHNLLD
ncbi:MAG TPA: heparan-alpha-glucosaminide N-acetyltransferase domain-containing protein, partial [Chitinophagaceae bacterium]|nr:heparan-alpha-glucosaminide N-acetyltransferase domain-containing protein [Chitinophagaceae bacterium]